MFGKLGEEYDPNVFGNGMLSKIFGPNRGWGDWEGGIKGRLDKIS